MNNVQVTETELGDSVLIQSKSDVDCTMVKKENIGELIEKLEAYKNE